MSNTKNHQESLFIRHSSNPILSAANWPYPVNAVFNAGATRLPDGTTLLLCRVQKLKGPSNGPSHLCVARSCNGLDGWEIDTVPSMLPDSVNYPEEQWGIEDPRITWIPELGRYAIVYTSFSSVGPGVSLVLTADFKSFERLGQVMLPENKDAALLPHRIGDKWALIHRPMVPRGSHIWLSYSPDLQYWGQHKLILKVPSSGWGDVKKIGLSTPLIETPEGWLMLYHGVRGTPGDCIYLLGLALFDLEDPSKLLARSTKWLFNPKAVYECKGDVPNAIFPCGYTVGPDGDTLNLYYGAADTSIALATASIRSLLEWLKGNSEQQDSISIPYSPKREANLYGFPPARRRAESEVPPVTQSTSRLERGRN